MPTLSRDSRQPVAAAAGARRVVAEQMIYQIALFSQLDRFLKMANLFISRPLTVRSSSLWNVSPAMALEPVKYLLIKNSVWNRLYLWLSSIGIHWQASTRQLETLLCNSLSEMRTVAHHLMEESSAPREGGVLQHFRLLTTFHSQEWRYEARTKEGRQWKH